MVSEEGGQISSGHCILQLILYSDLSFFIVPITLIIFILSESKCCLDAQQARLLEHVGSHHVGGEQEEAGPVVLRVGDDVGEGAGQRAVHHVADGVAHGRVLDSLIQEVQHGLEERGPLWQALPFGEHVEQIEHGQHHVQVE